jgi:hypothetical protein
MITYKQVDRTYFEAYDSIPMQIQEGIMVRRDDQARQINGPAIMPRM